MADETAAPVPADAGVAESLDAKVEATEPGEIAGTQEPGEGENAVAGSVNADAGDPNPQPDNSDVDGSAAAETHVNEGISLNAEGQGDIDTLFATDEDRLKRTVAAQDTTATTVGVTYEPGTDPTTVNVLGATGEANPDLVVPERGKPISHTENRSVPYELTDHHVASGPGAVDADGNPVTSPYVPQPQTPDPLTNFGGPIAAAYAKTLPQGAEPQTGAPRTDYDDDYLAARNEATEADTALPDHLVAGSEGGISFPREHRGISPNRTIGGRPQLAGEPLVGSDYVPAPYKSRSSIPQTPWGDALGYDAKRTGRPASGRQAESHESLADQHAPRKRATAASVPWSPDA